MALLPSKCCRKISNLHWLHFLLLLFLLPVSFQVNSFHKYLPLCTRILLTAGKQIQSQTKVTWIIRNVSSYIRKIEARWVQGSYLVVQQREAFSFVVLQFLFSFDGKKRVATTWNINSNHKTSKAGKKRPLLMFLLKMKNIFSESPTNILMSHWLAFCHVLVHRSITGKKNYD